jgi:hypothetical protein
MPMFDAPDVYPQPFTTSSLMIQKAYMHLISGGCRSSIAAYSKPVSREDFVT